MKALSLTQPWATLVMIGAKRLETRSWGTQFRGTVAIHAAKSFPRSAKDLCATKPFYDALYYAGFLDVASLPLGVLLGTVSLDNCEKTENFYSNHQDYNAFLDSDECDFGDYSPGRYVWHLSNPIQIFEITCRGSLGLWAVPPEIEAQMKLSPKEIKW